MSPPPPSEVPRRLAAVSARALLSELRTRIRAGLGRGALPNALIIGASKGGTTSLYHWLRRHPGVCASRVKEVQYFGDNYRMGPRWYAAQFAPRSAHEIRMEASPSYLWDPRVPERVRRLLGTPKLIVLLREPVERAWSQYWMNVRGGAETDSFGEALRREAEWFGPAGPFLPERSTSPAFYRLRSYLGKGVYAPQIERWLSIFPRANFHFIRSEDMFRSPEGTLSQLLRFLDLPPMEMKDLRPHNEGRYPPLDPEHRRDIQPFFAASNARVEQLTGICWPESVL